MIVYKRNILEELKSKGYNTYTLRNEKLLGENTIQKLRKKEMISLNQLDKVCTLLNCDIDDLICYIRR